jgi:isopenicillin N synthase-like dioxygenase
VGQVRNANIVTGDVPAIDLAPARMGDPAEKKRVATNIAKACEDIGFFLVSGHGVSTDVIESAYASARDFFDLPIEKKLSVQRRRPEVARGYNVIADQSLSYSLGVAAPPDLQESITFGPVGEPHSPYFSQGAGAFHFAPNLWPTEPPDFRTHATVYYQAMEQLSTDIMALFALALDLPQSFFLDRSRSHVSSMRFINYPDQLSEPKVGQLRAGEHTDYGALTILKVENAPGGLQVRNRTGEWIDIGYIPGTFVINIGDLMMRWTNDRWISTLHRVANPPRHHLHGTRRISLVYFHMPDYDAEVSAIPSCIQAGSPAKYPATTIGDYWSAKNKAVREMKEFLTTGLRPS